MTPALTLGLIAAAMIVALVFWALTDSAAIRSRYAGRRDHLAGRVNTTRCRTDLDYLDGATSEYLRTYRQKRGAR